MGFREVLSVFQRLMPLVKYVFKHAQHFPKAHSAPLHGGQAVVIDNLSKPRIEQAVDLCGNRGNLTCNHTCNHMQPPCFTVDPTVDPRRAKAHSVKRLGSL